MGKAVEASVTCLDTQGYSPLQKIESAGRICYDSNLKAKPGSDEGFVRGILKSGHESVVEHEGVVALVDEDLFNEEVVDIISAFPERCNLIFGGFIDARRVISGNFRVWRDALRYIPHSLICQSVVQSVVKDIPIMGIGLEECFKLCDPSMDNVNIYSYTSEFAISHAVFWKYLKMKHGTLTFRIDGVSRSLTHQAVRHRLCAISQRSQRYCAENSFDYVVPPMIGKMTPDMKNDVSDAWRTNTFGMSIIHDVEAYLGLQKQGIKKEDARYVLPNACATSLVMTATLNQWLHMIKIRTDKAAQWEIRNVFKVICDQICEIIPDLGFEDIKIGRDE
jgi:thymidylate synthase (FAD)